MADIKIYGTLVNNTTDQKLAKTNQIFDESKDKFQDIINDEVSTKIVEIDSRFATLIVDSLESESIDKALSAKQGKVLKQLIENLTNLRLLKVDVLPDVGESNIIYLVKKLKSIDDIYDEYVYIDGAWELIGSTQVDLSNYYTKEEITAILGDGIKGKANLIIQKNGVTIATYDGSQLVDITANITVPTRYEDIISILGYVPANANASGNVNGPVASVNDNFILFDGTSGKLIKDSGISKDGLAPKLHTHFASQITDLPQIPDITMITTGSGNAVVSVAVNPTNKHQLDVSLGGNFALSNSVYTKTEVYTKVETYTKDEVNSLISGSGGGDVLAPTAFTTADRVITSVGAGKSVKDSGILIGNLALRSDLQGLTMAWDNVTGKPSTFPSSWSSITNKPSTFTPSSHTHVISEITDFPTTWAWSNLSGVPSTFIPSVHKHNITDILEVQSGKLPYSYISGLSAVATSGSYNDLSNKPAIPDIPIALPNPYPIVITANKVTTNYTGASAATLNLDGIFSKSMIVDTSKGHVGDGGYISLVTGQSWFATGSENLNAANPDSVIIVESAYACTFAQSKYKKMVGLADLSGGLYKCYCLTWITDDLILVNGAVYG